MTDSMAGKHWGLFQVQIGQGEPQRHQHLPAAGPHVPPTSHPLTVLGEPHYPGRQRNPWGLENCSAPMHNNLWLLHCLDLPAVCAQPVPLDGLATQEAFPPILLQVQNKSSSQNQFGSSLKLGSSLSSGAFDLTHILSHTGGDALCGQSRAMKEKLTR